MSQSSEMGCVHSRYGDEVEWLFYIEEYFWICHVGTNYIVLETKHRHQTCSIRQLSLSMIKTTLPRHQSGSLNIYCIVMCLILCWVLYFMYYFYSQ